MKYGTDAIVFFAEYDRDSFNTIILRLRRSLPDDMKEIQHGAHRVRRQRKGVSVTPSLAKAGTVFDAVMPGALYRREHFVG